MHVSIWPQLNKNILAVSILISLHSWLLVNTAASVVFHNQGTSSFAVQLRLMLNVYLVQKICPLVNSNTVNWCVINLKSLYKLFKQLFHVYLTVKAIPTLPNIKFRRDYERFRTSKESRRKKKFFLTQTCWNRCC